MHIQHPYKDELCEVIEDSIFGKVAVTVNRMGHTLYLKHDKPTRLLAKECAECGIMQPRKLYKNGGLKENFYLATAYCNECEEFRKDSARVRKAEYAADGGLIAAECYMCGEMRPIGWYSEHSRTQLGYNTQCKLCLVNLSRKKSRLPPLSEEEYAPQVPFYKDRATKYGTNGSITHLECRECGKVKSVKFFFSERNGYSYDCKRCRYGLAYESEVGLSHELYQQD